MNKLRIYTDGACSGNPGPGGWAAILIHRDGTCAQEISGYESDTTNNRMELKAVVQSIKLAKKFTKRKLEIHSDSAYVVNAVKQGWLKKWKHNGWKTVQHNCVKNRDLWEELLRLIEQNNVGFVKVKGHSSDKYNNRCDELARREIEEKRYKRSESNGS